MKKHDEIDESMIHEAMRDYHPDSDRWDEIWENIRKNRSEYAARGRRKHMEKIIAAYVGVAAVFVLSITAGTGLWSMLSAGKQPVDSTGQKILRGDKEGVDALYERLTIPNNHPFVDPADVYRMHNEALDGQEDVQIYQVFGENPEIWVYYKNSESAYALAWGQYEVTTESNKIESLDALYLQDAAFVGPNEGQLVLTATTHYYFSTTEYRPVSTTTLDYDDQTYFWFIDESGTDPSKTLRAKDSGALLFGSMNKDGSVPMNRGVLESSNVDKRETDQKFEIVYTIGAKCGDLIYDGLSYTYQKLDETNPPVTEPTSPSVSYPNYDVTYHRYEKIDIDIFKKKHANLMEDYFDSWNEKMSIYFGFDYISGEDDIPSVQKMLFDDDIHTKWEGSADEIEGGSAVVWSMTKSVNVTGYIFTTANDHTDYPDRNPIRWRLYGTNQLPSARMDDMVGDISYFEAMTVPKGWVLIDAVNAADPNDPTSSLIPDENFCEVAFEAENPGSYRYFMLLIDDVEGVAFQMAELALYGNVPVTEPEPTDSPTYEEILALHKQDPGRYRDPGELQPETREMIRLEDGQWYQSYAAASFNCRFIFVSNREAEMNAAWDFVPIGSAENAFLYNIGVIYDDPSGSAQYAERSIAVRGTLAEGLGGYACQLILPDKLIVCLPDSDGGCVLTQTGTLAISEDYAALFENLQGGVVVTGVALQDENGVLYLRNVALFGASVTDPAPADPDAFHPASWVTEAELEPEGKTICNVTLEDDFASDSLTVVLSHAASIKFHEYGVEDFPEIDAVSVHDLLDNITEKYRQIAQNENAAQAAREQVFGYNQTLVIKLSEKSKENVLHAIRLLEQRDDVISAEPEFFDQHPA